MACCRLFHVYSAATTRRANLHSCSQQSGASLAFGRTSGRIAQQAHINASYSFCMRQVDFEGSPGHKCMARCRLFHAHSAATTRVGRFLVTWTGHTCMADYGSTTQGPKIAGTANLRSCSPQGEDLLAFGHTGCKIARQAHIRQAANMLAAAGGSQHCERGKVAAAIHLWPV